MRIASEKLIESYKSIFTHISKKPEIFEITSFYQIRRSYLLILANKAGFVFFNRPKIVSDGEIRLKDEQRFKECSYAVVLIFFPHIFPSLKADLLEFIFTNMGKNGEIIMKKPTAKLFRDMNYKMRKTEWLSSLFSNIHICHPEFYTRYLSPKKTVQNNAASPGKKNEKVATVPSTLMIAVLGWSGSKPNMSIEMYDSLSQKWYYLRQKNFIKRAYHGAVAMDGRLYVIGGFDGRNCYDTTFCFDLDKRCWSQKARMREVRCYVTALEYQNMIYAIGGYDGENRLKSCERFNFRTNRWIYMQSMNFRRSDASGTIHQDKIYMCGGFDGINILKSVEMYNCKSNQWTLIAPLMIRRSGLSLISLKGSLHALGGFDGISRLQTVELFDEENNRWMEGVSMLSPRSNFGAIVMADDLYVIGGYNGLKTISEVEKFDYKTQKWQKIQNLKCHRSALGACIFEDSAQHSICTFRDGVVVQRRNIEQTSP